MDELLLEMSVADEPTRDRGPNAPALPALT
jgi:hypothetical protein